MDEQNKNEVENNLEEVCSCGYFTKDGKIIHSVTCKKSSFFNHEVRLGFTEAGLEETRKDILKLEQELQKTREQLKKAEKVISADIGYNVFEFHRLREEYFMGKQGE